MRIVRQLLSLGILALPVAAMAYAGFWAVGYSAEKAVVPLFQRLTDPAAGAALQLPPIVPYSLEVQPYSNIARDDFTVIPAIGERTLKTPANALAKIARAYLEVPQEQGPTKLKAFVTAFAKLRKYG
jgi:hypothetical protein